MKIAFDWTLKNLQWRYTRRPSHTAEQVLKAEEAAIHGLYAALDDESRATKEQIFATVALMALSAMLSNDITAFTRHIVGLLQMLTAKSQSRWHGFGNGSFSAS